LDYPLVNLQKAIENGHRNSEFSHKNMVIFHSYVSLPEGSWIIGIFKEFSIPNPGFDLEMLTDILVFCGRYCGWKKSDKPPKG